MARQRGKWDEEDLPVLVDALGPSRQLLQEHLRDGRAIVEQTFRSEQALDEAERKFDLWDGLVNERLKRMFSNRTVAQEFEDKRAGLMAFVGDTTLEEDVDAFQLRARVRLDALESIIQRLEFMTPRSAQLATATQEAGATAMPETSSRDVFVVHGRRRDVRDALFALLRAVDLKPVSFEEALSRTGKPTPYIGDALEAGLRTVRAVIVLLTPDEVVELLPELRTERRDGDVVAQPRPNVLFEAGMAFALHPDSTILLQVGDVGGLSDISGKHVLRVGRDGKWRQGLVDRLRNSKCALDLGSDEWMTAGRGALEGSSLHDLRAVALARTPAAAPLTPADAIAKLEHSVIEQIRTSTNVLVDLGAYASDYGVEVTMLRKHLLDMERSGMLKLSGTDRMFRVWPTLGVASAGRRRSADFDDF